MPQHSGGARLAGQMDRVADIVSRRDEINQVRREVLGVRRGKSHTHLRVDRAHCIHELREVDTDLLPTVFLLEAVGRQRLQLQTATAADKSELS